MNIVHSVALAFALVLFILAGLNIGSQRFSLGWFGLAFLTLHFFTV